MLVRAGAALNSPNDFAKRSGMRKRIALSHFGEAWSDEEIRLQVKTNSESLPRIKWTPPVNLVAEPEEVNKQKACYGQIDGENYAEKHSRSSPVSNSKNARHSCPR